MTTAVTPHGGADGVDKAGSNFLDPESSFALDQILQSYDSFKMCPFAENDTTCSMGCAIKNIHERRAMTTAVTCHGGTDGVDKAGSSFLDAELSLSLDLILQAYDSWMMC